MSLHVFSDHQGVTTTWSLVLGWLSCHPPIRRACSRSGALSPDHAGFSIFCGACPCQSALLAVGAWSLSLAVARRPRAWTVIRLSSIATAFIMHPHVQTGPPRIREDLSLLGRAVCVCPHTRQLFGCCGHYPRRRGRWKLRMRFLDIAQTCGQGKSSRGRACRHVFPLRRRGIASVARPCRRCRCNYCLKHRGAST